MNADIEPSLIIKHPNPMPDIAPEYTLWVDATGRIYQYLGGRWAIVAEYVVSH